MNMHMSMSMRRNTAIPANSPHVTSIHPPVSAQSLPQSSATHRLITDTVTSAGMSENSDSSHI